MENVGVRNVLDTHYPTMLELPFTKTLLGASKKVDRIEC
jgi:hypothetical protein